MIAAMQFACSPNTTVIMTQRPPGAHSPATRYDRFFDLSRDLLCIADFDGAFVRVNPAFARATGYADGELLASPLVGFIHPDDRDATASGAGGLLRGEDISALESRFRCKDGSYIWLSWTATASVEAREIYAIARDVTGVVRERQATQLLAAASEALASTLDYRETLQNVARLIVPALADWCAIDLGDLGEADERLARVAIVGPEAREGPIARALQADPNDVPVIREVMERGAAHLLADARDDPRLRPLGIAASMVVPLIARGRTLGAINLITTVSGRRYDARDLALVEDLARRAALAVDNARLFQLSQEAQQQIASQAARLRAVAEASRSLAEASLDERAVLETVTREVADLLGDVCVIRLVSDDGEWLEPVSYHHGNPEALAFMRAMVLSASQRVDEGLNGRVMRTGQPLLIPHVAPVSLDAAIEPEYRVYRERFGGAQSILIVPWCLRGRTLGVLSISRERPGHPYTIEDQHLLQDLADRAAMAADNARLYREAQSAIRAREQFLTVAAHELRTPLTTIRGNAELILRRVRRTDLAIDRVALEERLGRLLTGIDRMSALAARLLDVTRMQTGAFEISTTWCDLVPIVAAVVERARGAAVRGAPMTIAFDAPATPIQGRFDPLRIEQVATNLIDNAVKYQPMGGMVRVQLAAGERVALLSVTDEGIGIAAEDLPRLFSSFVRAESATSQQIGGVGVGLYITDQIVRRHGGQIEVSSAVGQGTTFTVRLPLR
jgi:PAS domain S-box-containing protein